MPSPDPAGAPGPGGFPWLRALGPQDLDQAAEVYRDAVLTQAVGLYSAEQVRAWADHPLSTEALKQALLRGHGLVSCGADRSVIEAFALLDPADRLSLLYCRGRSCRQGRATALLRTLQRHAADQGLRRLRTEASQLSRPLLERQGWTVEAEETVAYDGVAFVRWRMQRELP